MDWTRFLGLIAAAFTTVAFLPQVIQSWKTKNMESISLPMYSMFTTGVLLWLIYGFLVKDMPVILANGFIFIFASSILILKIKYK